MSTIIYGVYVSGGEYDDHYHNLVKVWTKKSDADEQVFELTETRNRKKTAIDLKHEHFLAWEEANPNTLVCPSRRTYPKWTGIKNQDITQTMRDERNAIIAENNKQMEVYGNVMNDRQNARNESCKIHLIMKGLSEDLIEFVTEKYFYFSEDARYEIEEVELD